MDSLITIIIPTRKIDNYVEECLNGINKLSYKHIEVILLPNNDEKLLYDYQYNISIISTGDVTPSTKRNIGIQKSNGEILAFIDSDARPFPDWLNKAQKYLKSDEVGAVGGPNLTPPEDSPMQKASGDILASSIAWGAFSIRNKVVDKFEDGIAVGELPSCNLIVRKKIIQDIGMLDTSLLTAEDAKLCFEINKLGKKVLYAPDVKVYHHRRSLFLPHLKQMFIYGRDKMFLIKEDFGIDKLYYLIPLMFVIFLLLGLFSPLFNDVFLLNYVSILGTYIFVIFVGSIFQNFCRFHLIFPGIFLTHISYGIGSLYGLLVRK